MTFYMFIIAGRFFFKIKLFKIIRLNKEEWKILENKFVLIKEPNIKMYNIIVNGWIIIRYYRFINISNHLKKNNNVTIYRRNYYIKINQLSEHIPHNFSFQKKNKRNQ